MSPLSCVSRRRFLQTGVAVAAGVGLLPGVAVAEPVAGEPRFAFYLVGDTHYLADRENPGRMNERSATICASLVDRLNELPGAEIPANSGGGRVVKPAGLIHVGDVIDTGDKQGGVTGQMQKTEWAAFEEDYGLTGGDARLKFPVYELHGNHDSPQGAGHAIERIIARNKRRPDVKNVSDNGLHYSWDWQGVHFLNLGLIVGADGNVSRRRRYNSLDSLAFLTADLREQVGDSGRPVVIAHHVDIARYTGECDAAGPPTSKEWDPCDVAAFHRALSGYNVAAIFYGHTHARNVFRWDGTTPRAEQGIAVFNTDNGSHFGSDHQAILYVAVHERALVVREYQTQDRWQTGFFTPLSWQAPLGKG